MKRPSKRPPKPDDGYHTPVFPSWQATEAAPVDRLLCYKADGAIHAEDGRTARPETWDAFATLLHEWDATVYTATLRHALGEWWDCVLAEIEPEKLEGDTHTARRKELEAGIGRYVVAHYADNAAAVVSLTVYLYRRNRAGKMQWIGRHIVQASSWAGRTVGPDLLQDLRTLFDLVGVGACTTPGDLGAKAMARHWKRHDGEWIRHHRPTALCVTDLFQHAVGAAKETFYPDAMFEAADMSTPVAYELDRRNAFAAEAGKLPAGTVRGPLQGAGARRLMGHLCKRPQDAIESTTWFGACSVYIEAPGIALGDTPPFLARMLGEGDDPTQVYANRRGEGGNLYIPTEPGYYQVWLWKEQAEEVQRRRREEGAPYYITAIDRAWYWVQWTDHLAPWRDEMDAYRAGSDKQGADLVKACIVSGIGRLGMAPRKVTVSTEGGEHSIELAGTGFDDLPLYVSAEPADVPCMKHWHAYIWGMQVLSILNLAHQAHGQGLRPLAMNTDALFIERKPPQEMYVAPEVAKMGEYKLRTIRGFFAAPVKGSDIDPEKQKVSGMTPADKLRAMQKSLGMEGEADGNRRKRQMREAARRPMQAAANAAVLEAQTVDGLRRLAAHLQRNRERYEIEYSRIGYTPLARLEMRQRGMLYRRTE